MPEETSRRSDERGWEKREIGAEEARGAPVVDLSTQVSLW